MLIPIVNTEDEVIGNVERSEIDLEHDIFRTASVWIINPRDEILLAQRKWNKRTDPGKWAEAVGGTVEGLDSYLATALRELEEEIGITVGGLEQGPKQFITTPCNYFVQWYTLMIDVPAEELVIQPEEVEQVTWISREQLEEDLRTQPDKYIAAMPEILTLFPAIL